MDSARHSTVPTLEKSVENMLTIASNLLETCRSDDLPYVCICSPPHSSRNAEELTALLRRVMSPTLSQSDRANASLAAAHDLFIQHKEQLILGPDLCRQRFRSADMYCFDGMHFSAKVSRLFSSSLQLMLALCCIGLGFICNASAFCLLHCATVNRVILSSQTIFMRVWSIHIHACNFGACTHHTTHSAEICQVASTESFICLPFGFWLPV